MPNVKQEILDFSQKLPETVTLDQVMAKLYFKKQVDEGLRHLDAGKAIPHEQVEKRLSKWLEE